MLPEDRVRAVRRSVMSSDPAAALRALEPLGWGESGARTLPCAGLHGFERLMLGSFPTQAAVAVVRSADKPIDRTAYFGGLRWCLSVHEGAVRWHDFSAAETWSARADALTADLLRGFTPESFARLGRFEPLGVAKQRATDVPAEDASQYLFQRIDDWWRGWLSNHVSKGDEEIQRDRFVHALSALLLLKTVEDLDRLPWLPRGALRRAARRIGGPTR